MEAQSLAAVLAAVGAGTILRDLVTFGIRWFTGRSVRERKRTTNLIQQKDDAFKARDAADVKRREALEDVARYRVALIRSGINPDDVLGTWGN